jgi:hypothetical protein
MDGRNIINLFDEWRKAKLLNLELEQQKEQLTSAKNNIASTFNTPFFRDDN